VIPVRGYHQKLLLGISAVALLATAAADYALYRRSVESTLLQLDLVARFHVRLIDSMERFGTARFDPASQRAAFDATLLQLSDAYRGYPFIGRTGELVFGYASGGALHFVTRSGGDGQGPPAVRDVSPERAEPMRRALAGESGTLIGPDYRDVPVLAAFAPVPRLGLGVVAKIDLQELRAPYVAGGAVAGALIVLSVFLGALPALRSIAPLLRRLEESQDFSRSIVDTAVEGIVTFDEDGRIVSVNPAAERLFGYAARELLGSELIRLVREPADALEGAPAAAGRPGAATLDAQQGRMAMGRRKDGSRFPLELTMGTAIQGGQPLRTAFVRDVTPRVRAQEALRASQHLLQTVFDSIPYPIYLKDADARYQMVNRTMAAHHGLSPAQMLGLRIQDLPFRTEEEVRQIAELDRLVLERGEIIDFAEVLAHLAEGRVQWQRLLKVPYRDERGEVVGLIGVAIDITLRKRAEDELRASQRLLRTVFDTIPFPMTVKDLDSRYLMTNRAWQQTYGLSSADVLQRRALEIASRPLADREHAVAMDQEVIRNGGALAVQEMQRTTASRGRRQIRTYKTGFSDDQGQLVGIVSLDVDISDARHQEQALRDSQRLLRTVVDTIPHTLVVKDREGRYVTANRAWLEFYGLTEEQVVGAHTLELPVRPHEDLRDALEADRTVFTSGQPRVAEMVRTTGSRKLRILQDIRVPLRDEHGVVTGLVALAMDVTERRHAEEALRSSEERYRNLIEGSVQGVLIVRDEKPIFANQAYADLFGYASPEDVLARWSFERTFPPQERARMEGYQRARMSGQAAPTQYEVQAVRLDGAPIWLETSARRINWNGEAATQVSTHDVTERKRAEAALRASEERFRHLIEGSLQGVLILRNFKAVFANQALADLLGFASPGAVLADYSFDAVFPPEEGARMRDFHLARMSGGSAPTYYEVQCLRRDGTLVWVEASSHVVNWDGEQAVLITTHPIGERKRAEEALRASEERFRLLIEGSLQGILIYRNDRAFFVNRAFARMFGYDHPEQIVALPSLQELLDANDRPTVEEFHGVVSRSGPPADAPFQLVGQRRDGRKIQLEAFIQRIDWQGQRAFQATVIDVSDRAHLEEQLRQSQKMEAVGQLAGGVAHDFNNILQIMRGYTELAHGKTKDTPVGAYLERVLKAADGASHVVRQLMALSRREILRPRNLDVNMLISDLMQVLHRLIGEDIELTVRTGAQPFVVLGDAAMLEQVLLNLCVNARDAMPKGGELTIETGLLRADAEFSRQHGWCREGPYVAIRVTDTGMGISAENRLHVFEPFFTTKEAGKGTGLGLSMAYGIVQQHRGLMDVESEPGRGASFRIYLPAVDTQPDVSDAWVAHEAPGGDETVLVAEDEPGVLQLVVQLLEQRGYRVLKAADGDEAVRLFQRHAGEIDLALLDVVMPKQSGRSVYNALQARRPDLPVLFSTGYAADALDADFVRAHRFHIVRKPYSPNTLFRAVRNALDSPWPPAAPAERGEDEREGQASPA
jgi:PAS domain S-box-containing protein